MVLPIHIANQQGGKSMEHELYQLLLSLRIGDGCFVNQRKTLSKTYHVQTSSINKDYLMQKEKVFNAYKIKTRAMRCVSGYKEDSDICGFVTATTPEITYVGNMDKLSVIDQLDILGLIYYYLDDGSLHKTKHYMNIYCNSFCDEEVSHLVNKLYELFPIKRCSILTDRKKDGKAYPYIYVPVSVASLFSKNVRAFLEINNINSLLYKTLPPPQTIENI